MKTLTLFRHAKSNWKNSPDIDDFDRPLSERGVKAARKMGVVMRDYGLRPDRILCSPSVRTQETLALAAAGAWDVQPDIIYVPRLYHGSPNVMLEILRTLPEDVAHPMIVGHNPGLQHLAIELAKPDTGVKEQLSEKFPTAALASASFDIEHWQQLLAASGEFYLYITPKMCKTA